MSYSYTRSDTFTITHARHIASRIASDLRLLYGYYDAPSLDMIEKYLEETAQLLAKDYLQTLEVGFRCGTARLISLKYEVRADGTLDDSRSGGVRPGVDIAGARTFSFVNYSRAWWDLSESDRSKFKASLPIQRTTGDEPVDGEGHWVSDRTYAAGGTGVQRKSFVPW
jgi:hypothetical protein